ncbi:MAG: AP2 domain-containing protein, partial [bacterium]|nr:AP2 domain-containing protein [bacterium]
MKTIDLINQKFGRLIVKSLYSTKGGSRWTCDCECGNSLIVLGRSLKMGRTKSCGCLKIDTAGDQCRTHGMSHNSTYETWHGMKSRCNNINNKKYSDYGGRGIKVCEKWQNEFGFINFL